ncbi:MAG: hypothetical protein IKD09_00490 [Lentisphaeria bacterium]|nr:hypothetical protein [Lentisphaeria bacterium]
MALADKIAEKAYQAMKEDAVIISAADFKDGKIFKMQVYFWDEKEPASDIIKRNDLLEACPEAIYLININAPSERELLTEVLLTEIEEEIYFKIANTDAPDSPCDDLGNIVNVAYMETFEAISALRD